MPNCSHASAPPPYTRPFRSLRQCGLAKIAKDNAPTTPGGPCTAIAPTGSSICKLVMSSSERKAAKAAMKPMQMETNGVTAWQHAQLETRPANTPVTKLGMVIFGVFVLINDQAMQAKEPPEPASKVVTVARAPNKSVPPVVAKVEPGLKPRKPMISTKSPNKACTGLEMFFGFTKMARSTSSSGPWYQSSDLLSSDSSRHNLPPTRNLGKRPIRGPMSVAEVHALTEPTMCTIAEPAKSMNPKS
mmetsp:Transcript_58529/g.139589  ORF Transcript_58529/g.139589 Transcript_58529/m.139589 type:complete len:245 (-) Transcript_58529:763-1497(-)